jgi:hypothetical protein
MIMKNLSFENRVSLSKEKKYEDILVNVEALSSSYANRERFAFNHSQEFIRYTSEICTVPGVCLVVVAVGIYVYAGVVAAAAVTVAIACSVGVWDCSGGGEASIIDKAIYKNIV